MDFMDNYEGPTDVKYFFMDLLRGNLAPTAETEDTASHDLNVLQLLVAFDNTLVLLYSLASVA